MNYKKNREENQLFTQIDMSTWPMAQAFYYYTQLAPTSYTINVTMDVTVLRHTLKSKGQPPPNAYIISCIPWFTFNSFSLHNHGIRDYYLPSFEAGGIVEICDKAQMPLSVTVHHATTDGYHLKVFFEELQTTMNNPGKWL